MSELDAKIDMYQSDGWKLKERVGEHKAVMVKKTWGSLRVHLALLLLTLGIGNILYAIWSRTFSTEKMTLHGQ